MNVYNQLVDQDIVKRVNEAFYEKVYRHPWLSQYFVAVTKEFIISQQTDFIVGALGGPKNFSGRLPFNAHPHMFITDELFDLRKSLLEEALAEVEAPDLLIQTWLRIDESFRHVITKKSIDECERRWGTDVILNFPKPRT